MQLINDRLACNLTLIELDPSNPSSRSDAAVYCLLSIAASMFLFFSFYIKLFTMIGCHVVLTDDHGIIYETIIQRYSIVRIDSCSSSSFFIRFYLWGICVGKLIIFLLWRWSVSGVLTVHFYTKCDQSIEIGMRIVDALLKLQKSIRSIEFCANNNLYVNFSYCM